MSFSMTFSLSMSGYLSRWGYGSGNTRHVKLCRSKLYRPDLSCTTQWKHAFERFLNHETVSLFKNELFLRVNGQNNTWQTSGSRDFMKDSLPLDYISDLVSSVERRAMDWTRPHPPQKTLKIRSPHFCYVHSQWALLFISQLCDFQGRFLKSIQFSFTGQNTASGRFSINQFQFTVTYREF